MTTKFKNLVLPATLVAVDLTVGADEELSVTIAFSGFTESWVAPTGVTMNTHQIAAAIESVARDVPGVVPLRMGNIVALMGVSNGGHDIDIGVAGKTACLRYSSTSAAIRVPVEDAEASKVGCVIAGAISGALVARLIRD